MLGTGVKEEVAVRVFVLDDVMVVIALAVTAELILDEALPDGEGVGTELTVASGLCVTEAEGDADADDEGEGLCDVDAEGRGVFVELLVGIETGPTLQ